MSFKRLLQFLTLLVPLLSHSDGNTTDRSSR